MKMKNKAQIVIYQAEDGHTKLDVRLEQDTVWLSQSQLMELFQQTKQNISLHINNIFKEKELVKSSTVKEYLTVQTEGNRQVKRKITYYNLEVIISVGYRVKSKRGTQFRIWANQIIKDYLVKGYALNEKRLAEANHRLEEVSGNFQLMGRIIKQKMLSADEKQAFFNLISDYAFALDLLDKYDHQNVDDPKSMLKDRHRITASDALDVLKMLKQKTLIYFITLICLLSNNLFSQQLISDPDFHRGLTVLAPSGGAVQGVVRWAPDSNPPAWECAQWSSRSSLSDILPDTLPDGWLQWSNSEKTVQMGPPGVREYSLLLGIDSNSEYGGVYRTSTQPWPHLLVQQRLNPPGSFGPGCPSLAELAGLHFSLEAQLQEAEIIKKSGYDPNIHAAQFLVYFTIQNLNRQSAGYGKLIWLGVPVYDDREPLPAKYVAHDRGTNTLIYTIDYRSAADSSVHTGHWICFDVHLLPHAIAALNEAWRLGYLPDSHDLADYKPGGMNLGWEAPGLNIVSMAIRNLRLTATTTSDIRFDEKSLSPTGFELHPNFPNPFNPATTISYSLAQSQPVKLKIYNLQGREVAVLVNAVQPRGEHQFQWRADGFSSGIYLAALQVGGLAQYRKMLLIR